MTSSDCNTPDHDSNGKKYNLKRQRMAIRPCGTHTHTLLVPERMRWKASVKDSLPRNKRCLDSENYSEYTRPPRDTSGTLNLLRRFDIAQSQQMHRAIHVPESLFRADFPSATRLRTTTRLPHGGGADEAEAAMEPDDCLRVASSPAISFFFFYSACDRRKTLHSQHLSFFVDFRLLPSPLL